MDYEAIDKEMSSFVVTSRTDMVTRRFYLTDEGLATDITSRARRFRYEDQAQKVADIENEDPAWGKGRFDWKVISVPEMKLMDGMEDGITLITVVNSCAVRVDQSPMNHKRWMVAFECGHTEWITANRRPGLKRRTCKQCDEHLKSIGRR